MVGDISKAIGKEFLIAALPPAAVFVAMNVLFVRWGVLPRDWFSDWSAFGLTKPAAIVALAFASALILSSTSSLVYRVVEGYHTLTLLYLGLGVAAAGAVLPRTDAPPILATASTGLGLAMALLGTGQRLAHVLNRKRAARWLASLESAGEASKDLEQYRFSRRYPRNPALVRATALGNILRASEEYPSRLWGIDPITMWVRLTSVLPADFTAQISDAKIALSLLLNCCVVAVLLALETAVLAQPAPGDKWFWAGIIWMAAAAGAYGIALPAAVRWGEYIRSAFDIFRLELLVRMKIALPTGPFTFEDERALWAGLQEATFYTDDPTDSLHVVVNPKPAPKFRDPWDG